MKQTKKKEILKSIEITRESIKNVMDVFIESYSESISKLNLLTYLITSDEEK